MTGEESLPKVLNLSSDEILEVIDLTEDQDDEFTNYPQNIKHFNHVINRDAVVDESDSGSSLTESDRTEACKFDFPNNHSGLFKQGVERNDFALFTKSVDLKPKHHVGNDVGATMNGLDQSKDDHQLLQKNQHHGVFKGEKGLGATTGKMRKRKNSESMAERFEASLAKKHCVDKQFCFSVSPKQSSSSSTRERIFQYPNVSASDYKTDSIMSSQGALLNSSHGMALDNTSIKLQDGLQEINEDFESVEGTKTCSPLASPINVGNTEDELSCLNQIQDRTVLASARNVGNTEDELSRFSRIQDKAELAGPRNVENTENKPPSLRHQQERTEFTSSRNVRITENELSCLIQDKTELTSSRTDGNTKNEPPSLRHIQDRKTVLADPSVLIGHENKHSQAMVQSAFSTQEVEICRPDHQEMAGKENSTVTPSKTDSEPDKGRAKFFGINLNAASKILTKAKKSIIQNKQNDLTDHPSVHLLNVHSSVCGELPRPNSRKSLSQRSPSQPKLRIGRSQMKYSSQPCSSSTLPLVPKPHQASLLSFGFMSSRNADDKSERRLDPKVDKATPALHLKRKQRKCSKYPPEVSRGSSTCGHLTKLTDLVTVCSPVKSSQRHQAGVHEDSSAVRPKCASSKQVNCSKTLEGNQNDLSSSTKNSLSKANTSIGKTSGQVFSPGHLLHSMKTTLKDNSKLSDILHKAVSNSSGKCTEMPSSFRSESEHCKECQDEVISLCSDESDDDDVIFVLEEHIPTKSASPSGVLCNGNDPSVSHPNVKGCSGPLRSSVSVPNTDHSTFGPPAAYSVSSHVTAWLSSSTFIAKPGSGPLMATSNSSSLIAQSTSSSRTACSSSNPLTSGTSQLNESTSKNPKIFHNTEKNTDIPHLPSLQTQHASDLISRNVFTNINNTTYTQDSADFLPSASKASPSSGINWLTSTSVHGTEGYKAASIVTSKNVHGSKYYTNLPASHTPDLACSSKKFGNSSDLARASNEFDRNSVVTFQSSENNTDPEFASLFDDISMDAHNTGDHNIKRKRATPANMKKKRARTLTNHNMKKKKSRTPTNHNMKKKRSRTPTNHRMRKRIPPDNHKITKRNVRTTYDYNMTDGQTYSSNSEEASYANRNANLNSRSISPILTGWMLTYPLCVDGSSTDESLQLPVLYGQWIESDREIGLLDHAICHGRPTHKMSPTSLLLSELVQLALCDEEHTSSQAVTHLFSWLSLHPPSPSSDSLFIQAFQLTSSTSVLFDLMKHVSDKPKQASSASLLEYFVTMFEVNFNICLQSGKKELLCKSLIYNWLHVNSFPVTGGATVRSLQQLLEGVAFTADVQYRTCSAVCALLSLACECWRLESVQWDLCDANFTADSVITLCRNIAKIVMTSGKAADRMVTFINMFNQAWVKTLIASIILSCYDDCLLKSPIQLNSLSLSSIFNQFFFLLPKLKQQNLEPDCLHEIETPNPPLETSPKKRNNKTAERVNKRNGKGESSVHIACIRNDAAKLKELLTVPGVDVNLRDNCGWTPLHEACNHGSYDCVKLLLEYEPQNVGNGQMLQLLRVEIDARGDEGCTPLHDAVLSDNVDICRLLLKYGGEKLLESMNQFDKRPVDLASSDEVRKALTCYNCEPGPSASELQEPLTFDFEPQPAIIEVQEVLTSFDCEPIPQPFTCGNTAPDVHSAQTSNLLPKTLSRKQNNKTVEKVNKRNHKGESAVHIACIKSDAVRLKELLAVPGVDVNLRDNCGWTPLHEACNHGSYDCVKLLLEYEPMNVGNGQMLQSGKVEIDAIGYEGRTPLHDAVLSKNVEICKLLLKYGGEKLLEYKNHFGYKPVHLAFSSEVREALNYSDCDTTHEPSTSELEEASLTCFDCETEPSTSESGEALTFFDCEPATTEAQDDSTFYDYEPGPSTSELEALTFFNCEPTPQHFISGNSSPIVDSAQTANFLLRTSHRKQNNKTAEKVNKRNHKGESAVHIACIKSDAVWLKELLAVPGVDVNLRDNCGWTPLHEACNHGSYDCVKLLLDYKPVDVVSGQILKSGKVEIDAKGDKGCTPLHDAVENNNADICKLLLKYGGKKLLDSRDQSGLRAIDLVSSDEVREILNSFESMPEVVTNENSTYDASTTQASQYTEINHSYTACRSNWEDFLKLLSVLLTSYCEILVNLKACGHSNVCLHPADRDMLENMHMHIQNLKEHVKKLTRPDDYEHLQFQLELLEAFSYSVQVKLEAFE